MEQKLLNMFDGPAGSSDSCLGMKYKSNGLNIWSMENQPQVIQNLFGKKVKKKDTKLDNLNKVFHEDAHKMEYYNMAKKGYVVSDDAVKARSIEYFHKCAQQKAHPIPAFTKIKDQQLYLTQTKINDIQSEYLKEFLISQKNVAEY